MKSRVEERFLLPQALSFNQLWKDDLAKLNLYESMHLNNCFFNI